MIKCSEAFGKIIERRKRYFTPDEMETVNVMHGKLILLEEMEKQGRLVILPCKVGDTIYVIFDGKIWDGEVYHISYSDYYGKITATAWVKQGISAAFEHFGKTVFLSREEAEAALKGEREDV